MIKEVCPVTKEFCNDLELHKIRSGPYKGGSLLWCKEDQRDPVYMGYCPRKLPELEGREKIRRIQQLKELGLNCPEYMVIRKPSDTKYLDKHPKWSIRSFPTVGLKVSVEDLKSKSLEKFKEWLEPNVVPPHAPSISTVAAKLLCKGMLKLGYYPMPCPVIDPKDALWAGCAYRGKNKVKFELAIGPVMVRKVSRDGEIDISLSITRESLDYLSGIDLRLYYAAVEIFDKVPPGFILELSCYTLPIGIKQQNLIFWDIMPSNKYEV